MAVQAKKSFLDQDYAKPIILGGSIWLALKYALPSVLDALNPFKKSEKERATDEAVSSGVASENAKGNLSAWNGNYWREQQRKGVRVVLVTQANADEIAKRFYDSVGRIYDSPTVAEGALKLLNSKCKVSWVAERFNALYKNDLLSWLTYRFDTAEQKAVLERMLAYVEKLPVTG